MRRFLAGFGFVLLTFVAAVASADEFRMDTDVYLAGQKEPIGETLTLFTGDQVYDFTLSAPQEIVVFDSNAQRGTFTLLDVERRQKTVISTQDVLDYVREYQLQSRDNNDPTRNKKLSPLFAFAANPEFAEHAEVVAGSTPELTRIKLEGNPLSYTVTAHRPKHLEAVQTYRNFTDWIARLNSMRSGNLPPEARIRLNRALSERGLLPQEITRTIVLPGNSLLGEKKSEVTSKHLVNWTLAGSDHKRIEQAQNYLVTYPTVSFENYVKAQNDAQLARKK